MEISIRDKSSAQQLIGSQSGQAITEYILILVVVIGVILGTVYQFNDAFKVYLNNYFGEYIACLLETGELPTIETAPGDSGICTQLFKPFSLADGRPLIKKGSGGGGTSKTPGSGKNSDSTKTGQSSSSSKSGSGGGAGGSTRSSGGGGGSGGSGSRGFSEGRNSSFGSKIHRHSGTGSSSSEKGAYTGSTDAGDYGSRNNVTSRRSRSDSRQRLDTKFAFDKEETEKTSRVPLLNTRAIAGNSNLTKSKTLINRKSLKGDIRVEDDEPFTFGSFLRILLIIALIIGLVVTLGGQFLQIGKSSE